MKAKYIFPAILLLGVGFSACDTEENDFKKVTFPYTDVVGEYVVNLELTQPFAASDVNTIIISNTAANNDSLWIEDGGFFESKVRVNREDMTFSVTEGHDLFYGETVNIQGQVFPENDSIHVEWRYLQMTGDPADDYVVEANGVLYNGIDN